ncbi:MAG: Nitrogen regulatory protein [Candidatus Omnitrophica bacterium ADurb.Bin314]|jgi:PTS system nitrogen regulatory IIA component|nr:MAG: Nitrogen regulatory protein [Candidatus Omnitrophica bacterium ADurb.Bin314]HOE68960.1 PTS sugar transporter subunit IIA [Candidatus Omnitrophota bacterium]
MQLTFRKIEKAFEVDEKTLYQWLNDRGMPAVKANGQYLFNSVEVLEWALKHRIPLTLGALKLCERNRPGQDILTPALLRGGVHTGVKGERRDEIFGEVLNALPLPASVDKLSLKAMLISREQVGTTGIGNGIAIPHVKHPVIFAGLDPIVGLFFLEKPVNFAAPDGERVHTLFVILSGSFRGHLSLLSRLAFCLQDLSVKTALDRRASPEEILTAFQVAEAKTGGGS